MYECGAAGKFARSFNTCESQIYSYFSRPTFHFSMNEEQTELWFYQHNTNTNTELWFYQHNTIVILAFVSGASFVSLIIIFALFFFCR